MTPAQPGTPTPSTEHLGGTVSSSFRAEIGAEAVSGRGGERRSWWAAYALLPTGIAQDVTFEVAGGRFVSVTPNSLPGAAAALPGWSCQGSRTLTAMRSIGHFAAGPTMAAAPSGPGASGCMPLRRSWTRTPTSRWPPRRTPRWRWLGSRLLESSTTCTMLLAGRPMTIRTPWARPCVRPPPMRGSG